MRYFTREWYELSQCTGLHFGMKVHNDAAVYDEELYLKLYRISEKEYVESQRNIYNVDPRFMLEVDGHTYVPLHKFVNGEEIEVEDEVVYHMAPEEKERIQILIDEYDARPPFDEYKAKEEFRSMQEWACKKYALEKLPHELIQQIADMRVFSLGYCTELVLQQLERLSEENEMKVNQILEDYEVAQQAEDIPQKIRERFGFHDCRVTAFTVSKDAVLRFDTHGGFTDWNKTTFVQCEIIKQDDTIVDSFWIYHELYRTEKGYEAHMLFDKEGLSELIISCRDIIVETE